MPSLAADRCKRHVSRALEQLGSAPPLLQQARDQPDLWCAIVHPSQNLRGRGIAHLCEQALPVCEVDGSAVVWIYQAQVPHLRALVKVRHTWTRQQQRRLRERRSPPQRDQLGALDEGLQVASEVGVDHDAGDELRQGVLVCRDRVDPRCVDLAFASGFQKELSQALDIDRPCSDQRLVHQVFDISVGVSVRAMLLVVLCPSPHRIAPLERDLREQIEPRADVGAPLGVVRRQRQHCGRPV